MHIEGLLERVPSHPSSLGTEASNLLPFDAGREGTSLGRPFFGQRRRLEDQVSKEGDGKQPQQRP